MKQITRLCCAALGILTFASHAQEVSLDSAPPVVVKTYPVAGAMNVDPSITEIRVTFSKDMKDGTWSWSTLSDDSFPKTTGSPRYLEDGRTCVLPVKLEAGKYYATWLNSPKFRNFKDASGQPAVPYLLTFETAAATELAAAHRNQSDSVAAAVTEAESIKKEFATAYQALEHDDTKKALASLFLVREQLDELLTVLADTPMQKSVSEGMNLLSATIMALKINDTELARVLMNRMITGAPEGTVTFIGYVQAVVNLDPEQKTTLALAISRLKFQRDWADLKHIQLTRIDPKTSMRTNREYDFDEITKDPRKDPILIDGDFVTIHEKKIRPFPKKERVIFTGFVHAVHFLRPGEETTLFEAISSLNFQRDWADLNRIQIIRIDPKTKLPVTLEFNIDVITKDPRKDPVLVDGDNIMIPEKKFTIFGN